LQAKGLAAYEWEIIRYVLRLLKADFPLHAILRGIPEGSLPEGYVMNNADGQGLYIELTIERDTVWVISFHVSKHFKGA
jgi:hypothetical protein